MEKVRKEAHLWQRDTHDWYVEPHECSRALFQRESFEGLVWDPACGFGRIVRQANLLGMKALGTDIVKRGELCESVIDFFSDDALYYARKHTNLNIVTNPPFGRAEDFVLRAIELLKPGQKLAAILPIVWLAGFSSKRSWLPKSPLKRVYPISPRPSMPPGRVILAGQKPGNGTKDYCWLVWEGGFNGHAEVDFLNTSIARAQLRSVGSDWE